MPSRTYLSSRYERWRRHIRQNGTKATIFGISVAAIVAGFLSATGVVWPLLAYIGIIGFVSALALCVISLPSQPSEYLMLWLRNGRRPQFIGQPRQLELTFSSPNKKGKSLVLVNRCDDPVYGAGLRVLMDRPQPIIIMPSNPRDVSKPHELLYPMYVSGQSRSRVELNLQAVGIPIPALKFERELPEGAQDPDHTLAIRDLAYLPDLVLALQEVGARIESPVTWPEHCVDPMLIASRDVIVIGGPDTNFWHAALFEAVSREFEAPRSSVPLAMSLRELRNGLPVYGSRSILLQLFEPTDLPRMGGAIVELDERLFPTYGMILACRNPFAAAVGISRWCVFVAGTRSLGTSGAVLGLTAMLRGMQNDSDLNFSSTVGTFRPGVQAQVTAILCRTSQVERAMIRREDKVIERQRQELPRVGLDPYYSDTYLPTSIEYLHYVGTESSWEPLCSIPGHLQPVISAEGDSLNPLHDRP
jgi:hypothetical protein